MIKNYYYFVVGILCVLFAFTHAWNGHTAVLKIFETNSIDINTKTVFHYVWDIITVENLIFGIILLFMSFYKDLTKVRFVAYLIAIILVARWAVILFYTMYYNQGAILQIIPDTIAILFVVILLFLGSRLKSKDANV
jgi:tryptophan-rich sensory protein